MNTDVPSALSTRRATAASTIANGLWAPCPIPRDANGALDLGALRALVAYAIDGGVNGLAFGCVGIEEESAPLSTKDMQRLLTSAVSEANGRIQVLAGIYSYSAQQTKMEAKAAREHGCDGILLTLAGKHPHSAFDASLPVILAIESSMVPNKLGDIACSLSSGLDGVLDSRADAARVSSLRKSLPKSMRVYNGAVERSAGADGCFDPLACAFPREAAEAFHGSSRKSAYLGEVRKRIEASKRKGALLRHVLCALGMPIGEPAAPVAEAESNAAKAAVSLGGRLVAGEAGRAIPRTESGSGKHIHFIDPTLADRVLLDKPLPSHAVSLWKAFGPPIQYGCHPFIAHHSGRFFVSWSGGLVNEDSPGQTIRFATSPDGVVWSKPRSAVPVPQGMGRWTPGGFWALGDRLLLLAIYYTRARYVEGEQTPGTCWEEMTSVAFIWNGDSWERVGAVLDDIYINEPPRRLPDGRWMMTGVNGRHDALVAIANDSRLDQWNVQVLAPRTAGFKLTEPSWYPLPDGRLRVLLRDDGGSRCIWLCESADGGATWSTPAPTNFPDAQAKFYAMELPDRSIALIGNPDSGEIRRRLLAISRSRDGLVFDSCRKIVLDENASPRLKGMHKSPGFHYPNACVANGRLWIVYSIGKEDIEVRSIALRLHHGSCVLSDDPAK